MSEISIPHTIILRFTKKIPGINNASLLQEELRLHDIDGTVQDITEWPFISFDVFDIQYVLNKAGFTGTLSAGDVYEVGESVTVNPGVKLARRAYLSAVKFVACSAYEKGVHLIPAPLVSIFNSERQYVLVTENASIDKVKASLSRHFIDVFDVSRLPALSFTYADMRFALIDVTKGHTLSTHELNAIAKSVYQEKTIQDLRLLYLHIAQDACIKEATRFLAEKENTIKKNDFYTQQQQISTSFNEASFGAIKEEMQIPAGFKKIEPINVGNIIIGDLKLEVKLNKGPKSSELDFTAYVPSEGNSSPAYHMVDSFVLSLPLSDLKGMSLSDLEGYVSNEVSKAKDPMILAYSVTNTAFWQNHKV
ncbi:hypothetical protein [Selenomonas ruminantium]|uniref:hypothetical protein n=1 Tax=Selenomonas ruminantium TaxID=971 RepID=UPI0026EFE9AA|nr:hypothetical protein [Selenomonas ruminantium]